MQSTKTMTKMHHFFRIHPSSSFSSSAVPAATAVVVPARRSSMGPAPLNLISLRNHDSSRSVDVAGGGRGGGGSSSGLRRQLSQQQPLPSLPVRKRGARKSSEGGIRD